jgi:hypothetical protein
MVIKSHLAILGHSVVFSCQLSVISCQLEIPQFTMSPSRRLSVSPRHPAVPSRLPTSDLRSLPVVPST